MNNSVPGDLHHLAAIASAPVRDFRHWRAGVALERPTFAINGTVRVLSYKVPKGYSLVLTDVQSWVANPYTGATPGNPQPTSEVLNWGSLFGYFAINDDIVTDQNTPYFAVSKGGLLRVFPPTELARFWLYNGGPAITPGQFSMSFIFSGYLTLPEHAARLEAMQTVAPNSSELSVN